MLHVCDAHVSYKFLFIQEKTAGLVTRQSTKGKWKKEDNQQADTPIVPTWI